MSSLHPAKFRVSLLIAGLGAAVSASLAVARAPFAGTITGVSYVPNAAIAGAATNTRTLSLKNRGLDGLGVLVPATLPLVAGVNAVAFDEKAIPVSGVTASVTVAKGDILSLESISAGTGIVDPGGLLIVEFTRS